MAAATCLTNFPLMRALPVLLVGRGAAFAQSTVDSDGSNRTLTVAVGGRRESTRSSPCSRSGQSPRYRHGIADLMNRVADHTGTNVPDFAAERGGRIGDLVADQGSL